jgi:hypothetical protein
LMHPCCCILFYVMSGFIQMLKGFENHLKTYLENCFRKRKGNSFHSHSSPSYSACWPNHSRRPTSPRRPAPSPPSPLWPWLNPAALLGRPKPKWKAFTSLHSLTNRPRPSAPPPTSSRHPASHAPKPQPPSSPGPTFSTRGGSVRALDSK